jgi:hypothetical protein
MSDKPMNGRMFIQGRACSPLGYMIPDFVHRSDVSDGRQFEAAWPTAC